MKLSKVLVPLTLTLSIAISEANVGKAQVIEPLSISTRANQIVLDMPVSTAGARWTQKSTDKA